MKKALILGLILSFTATGSVSAYSEHFEDGFANPVTAVGLQNSENTLEDAVKKRQWFYFKQKIRDAIYKNRLNQKQRHQYSKSVNHVDERSTQVERDGALRTVPYYQQRREYNNASYIRTNPKQTFRKRAINYYLEGGVAGKDALSADVLYGSTHRVSRVPSTIFKENAITTSAKSSLLEGQRSIGRSAQVPTGYQKTTFRRGDSTRTYLSPYQRFE